VEEQYTRKTPLEHILIRPGMYIGPVESSIQNCWALEPIPNHTLSKSKDSLDIEQISMKQREKKISPALQKIFDEILINASDNHLRHPKSCNQIDVTIDPGCNRKGSKSRQPFISIRNNGKGIPVQIHKEEKLYLPEMLFGHLLTGSNFDDDAKRITGGRHGYGAKLTNIFSKSFTVETVDARKKLKYEQSWLDNMSEATPPTITKTSNNEQDYTKVSFVPDIARLTGKTKGLDRERLGNDIHTISQHDYEVLCRRIYDIAGCTGQKLKVTLNGETIPISNFQTYSKLFSSAKDDAKKSKPICFQKINPRWEVGIALSDTGSFESVSFVNGMATSRGGTHVNVIAQQVVQYMSERIEKMHPALFKDISTRQVQSLIRRNLMIFCNALIENPSFDSQMKECLTSSPANFGSKYALPATFLKRLVKETRFDEDGHPDCSPGADGGGPGIIEEVVNMVKGYEQANLLKEVSGGKKKKRQILSIAKLDDAHLAGTKKATDCTLILTEGDSAKALAVAGLSVIGREKYGVFPLRGKFLNVRDATLSQLTNNQELKNLCSIIGLDFNKTYDTWKERSQLRYGHVMLMTDQDSDGSHIKGLIMNVFRHFWPSLLKPVSSDDDDVNQMAPFLSSFITPLLKATSKRNKKTKSFYSVGEYEQWRQSLASSDELKKWSVKYYKGLGTSTPAEAKEYFLDFEYHQRPFLWNSDRDGEQLDMVFEKSRVADRREWILNEFDEESTYNLSENHIVSYEDFINKELVNFSNADNVRSLPSIIDGLKPSQRKVLFACFKRNLKHEIKVAQLAGYCAEHTSYHHGEASLHATIIGMAQDFVGSNNINLLEPSGQFGTRLDGGKDAASPRYIFTKLKPIARKVFPEIDDVLLKYKVDDGQRIEPSYFCPVIPLILVNGSQGIGTGWSTSIPSHNPKDVLDYIKAKLESNSNLPRIRPWVRNFQGEIQLKEDKTGYISMGNIKKMSSTRVKISELPVGRWTNDYKTFLLRMRDKGEIQTFEENHTTTSVSFTITLKSVQLKRMIKSGLNKSFRLEAPLPTTNMHAFDDNFAIRKYENPENIIEAFFPIRLNLYRERKQNMERLMNYESQLLKNKSRFISDVSDGCIDIINKRKSKADTESILVQMNYDKMSHMELMKDGIEADKELECTNEFDYLLNMPLSSLTSEKFLKLTSEAKEIESKLIILQNTSPEDLWYNDLKALETYL